MEHKDLAFSYAGADEFAYGGTTGSFPYIYANNSASKNTDMNNATRLVNDYFYGYALGIANSRSVIIDLLKIQAQALATKNYVDTYVGNLGTMSTQNANNVAITVFFIFTPSC